MKTYWKKMKERRDAEEDGLIDEPEKKSYKKVGCLSVIGAVVVVLFLIQFIPGFVVGFKNGFSQQTSGIASSASTSLTKANFDKIKDGDSYDKVCNLLGRKGKPISEIKTGNVTTAVYMWYESGASVSVSFQSNKAVSMTETGLD